MDKPTADQMLGMSDEDFLQLNDPVGGIPDSTTEDEATTHSNPASEGDGEASEESGAAVSTTDAGAGAEGNEQNPPQPETENTGEEEKSVAAEDSQDGNHEDNSTGSKDAGTAESKAPTPEAAIEFYQQVMSPLKANGKMIQLNSPEEARSLMQMGANYTRKMQEIAPHRKVLAMLQNNSIDEGKLSFLIDLDKKDPEAIKKFIKDNGIDPMDIDTSTDPAYIEGNNRVTDEEVAFRSALDDLSSTESGRETLIDINTTWDEASKQILGNQPEILGVIQEQRESGIYAVITAEMERQRTLGQIKPDMPFLQAYKLVGDHLVGLGASGTGAMTGQPAQKAEPQILATRTATPKPQVANSDKAKAASVTPASAGTKGAQKINPLSLSDEDFLKLDQFAGRV